MRIRILAVGRLRAGPEADLVADYLARARAAGRGLGFTAIDVVEIDERKARDGPAQSAALLAALGQGAHAVALDERGETMPSDAFAAMLARLAERGVPETAFLIGGADGHDDLARARADRLLSFGPMVWPHMLARAMLAEQIYRATAILSGAPYHRA